MDVLFFQSNSGFPIEKDGKKYNPPEVIGGYIFSMDKQHILDEMGVDYEIKDKSEIEFIQPEIIEEDGQNIEPDL